MRGPWELRQAGAGGSMDELRAIAYLDLLLGRDSRPGQDLAPGRSGSGHQGGDGTGVPGRTDSGDPADGDPADGGPGGSRPAGGSGGGGPGPGPGPGGSVIPAGFAGKINLTVPATTLLDLADRPGELAGIGPVDPDLARDLAAAAAANPKTTWCVTVTDQDGQAIGHGCARPEPRNKRGKTGTTGTTGGPDPPGSTSRPRFRFTPDRRDGPPGGWGTWRLATGVPGRPDLILRLAPIATDPCDHRYQARGHDPGVLLRHLTQIRYATCTGPGCRLRRPSRLRAQRAVRGGRPHLYMQWRP